MTVVASFGADGHYRKKKKWKEGPNSDSDFCVWSDDLGRGLIWPSPLTDRWWQESVNVARAHGRPADHSLWHRIMHATKRPTRQAQKAARATVSLWPRLLHRKETAHSN